MQNNPVVVFVTDDNRSQAFITATNLVTFGADTMRDALSQVIFSYPDVIVIDASQNMLRAEDTFFHLRTINHPPIIVLSNVVGRWEMHTGNSVIVMPEDSSDFQIEETIRAIMAGETPVIC
ncbi:MAG: hypothetical protein Phog2KO_31120 [Phototrophicaceae bacterium]